MPGPAPKNAALRQRRNKTSTKATLVLPEQTEGAETSEKLEPAAIPELPKKRKWHYLTVEWWNRIWQSPMAPEYLEADLDGLFILAVLVDKFWRKPSKELAGEIRLQRQCFGLSPIDRRRLQWEVEKVESVSRRKRPPIEPPQKFSDPRDVLRVLG